jgi:ribosomal protein S6--L-glutamate ligase/gamma-F420-2:alpha-L-glutamate ligase
LDYARWLAESARNAGITAELIANNEILTYFQNGRCFLAGKENSMLPDFVLFTDKDILLARQFERMGIPVYNSSSAIEICDNKILMYEKLALEGIPFPKTAVSPKIFGDVTDYLHLESFIKEIGFPMVLKEAYGSFGQQVYLVSTKEELQLKIQQLGAKDYIVQEFIAASSGRDIRVNIVGGRPVASMLRRSSTDFRANVSAGGTMEPYTPTKEEAELAAAAAKAAGTDFAGVDLLFTEDGLPTVCEVNSNAHIRSIYSCTGINVADHILSYIKEKMYG